MLERNVSTRDSSEAQLKGRVMRDLHPNGSAPATAREAASERMLSTLMTGEEVVDYPILRVIKRMRGEERKSSRSRAV